MTDQNKTTPAVQASKEGTPSERFMNAVLQNYTSTAGPLQATNFQKKIAQNYFVKLDMQLKALEQKRMQKDEKYREALAYDWQNLNINKLALDVVAYSSIGLDPLQPNHINLIPYKNNSTGKYDITFMMGYQGLQLKAKKYGYDVPDQVVVELVYETDEFETIKKDIDNHVESYRFKVHNEFERGEIIGGFYYFMYDSAPQKNKLRVFSLKDILKRRPDTAATEFWGGEKDEWKDGKKTGKKIEVEGWFEEMCFKTIARAAYNAIPIDSQKIDEHIVSILQKEAEYIPTKEAEFKSEIQQNTGKVMLEIKPTNTEQEVKPEEKETNAPGGELFPKKDNAPF
jgi:recombination protein RecT